MNSILATLEDRRASVLEAVIREHIRTAEPVGSMAVAEHYRIDASPATIRSEMAELEALGFLRQPHTSAGRVPTEQAYQYYVAHFLKDEKLPRSEVQSITQLWRNAANARHEAMKATAKMVALLATESVFMTFGNRDTYHTGLAHLFAQPEFADQELVEHMGAVLDHLDERVADLFQAASSDVRVFIAEPKSFGSACSVVVVRYDDTDLGQGIFGILGPTRMDYDLNVARAKLVQECLQLGL